MHTEGVIATHTDVRSHVNQGVLDAINAAYDCAEACTSCAGACVAEEMVMQLRQCMRLTLDCAAVCAATATVASRRTGSNEELIRRMLDACIVACQLCEAECQHHATEHDHCRACAESCRRCGAACRSALKTF